MRLNVNKLFCKFFSTVLVLGSVAPLYSVAQEVEVPLYEKHLLNELTDTKRKIDLQKSLQKAEEAAKNTQNIPHKKLDTKASLQEIRALQQVQQNGKANLNTQQNRPEEQVQENYALEVLLVECLSLEQAKELRLPHKVQETLNKEKDQGALLEEHTACAPLIAHVIRRSSLSLALNTPKHDDARRSIAYKYQRPIVKKNDQGAYYLETLYEGAQQTLGTFLSVWMKEAEEKLQLNLYAHSFTSDGDIEEVVYHNHDKVFVHTRPQVLERVLLLSEAVSLDKEYILSGDVYMRRQAPERLNKLMPEKGRLWAVVKLSKK